MSAKVYLYKRVVQAKLFIDKHFNERIDLTQIADQASFSKFHFIRLFKTCYGKTPHQYLSAVRIENAKLLLQKGMTVSEVCASVGFESFSSFTGLFKQHVGRSPSAYQQVYQERHQEIKDLPLRFIPNCFAQQKGWVQKSNFEEAN